MLKACPPPGYNFKHNTIFIMKINKRSARQRFSANVKHSARLKAMKSMKFSFRSIIKTKRELKLCQISD